MSKDNITEAAAKIVEILNTLKPDEKHRAASAALIIAGATALDDISNPLGASKNDGETDKLSARAKTWMKQNGLKLENFEQIFDIENDKIEIILSKIPGDGKREQTFNTYILTGIKSLLLSGDTTFDDRSARSFCVELGCYDGNHHSANIKTKDNRLIGSKSKGWKLSTPGLNCGAKLIKEIIKNE